MFFSTGKNNFYDFTFISRLTGKISTNLLIFAYVRNVKTRNVPVENGQVFRRVLSIKVVSGNVKIAKNV